MLLTGGLIVFASVDADEVIIIRVPICGRLVGDLLFDTFWGLSPLFVLLSKPTTVPVP